VAITTTTVITQRNRKKTITVHLKLQNSTQLFTFPLNWFYIAIGTLCLRPICSSMWTGQGWARDVEANLPNRYSALCWRPVTHEQTWASYRALYRLGRLSDVETEKLTSRDRDETETLASSAETRLRRDVCSSRDVIETLKYKFYWLQ